MFPLAVQYFSPKCGVKNKALDYMGNEEASAAGILACIEQSLDNLVLLFD